MYLLSVLDSIVFIVGKKVKLSSQYPCLGTYCFPPSRAVDGVYAPSPLTQPYPEWVSIAITNTAANEWLQIDLEEPHCVSAVKIWNRQANYRKF